MQIVLDNDTYSVDNPFMNSTHAAVDTTRRYFYRCTGCLEVSTLSAPLGISAGRTEARCGICAQTMEYMGRTERDLLVTDHTRCACDERCTSARGPICNCHCGGENHGKGMAADITYTVAHGTTPVVMPPDPFRRTRALSQYRTFAAARDAMRAELGALLDRRAAGEFMPRPSFDRMRELQRLNGKIDSARTHAGRMKMLQAIRPATAAA
ncbi:MAG TPA: hypothetical protein VNN99_03075 [Vicinamibacterales bacterium]|nr:hypothetical protein [Vicinamibacterales bacterium]